MGESLALFMGLLEYDRSRPGHTRIPTHTDQWADTGNNTRAWLKVLRLNYPGGLQDTNSSVSGIRFYLDVHRERLNYMRNRKVTFDFGAWLQTSLDTSMLPYITQAFPTFLIALEPDRWMLQVQPDGFIRFDHRVEEIMGTHLVNYEGHLILPALDMPIRDTGSLSNLDFSKCFVEVDVVAMSMSGKEQRHTLVVVPFQPQQYGQTCEHHPTHLDFRPLAAPTRHLNQLRVHLRNSEDVGVPFYTGLVGLLLYFHKGPARLPSSMRLQGGRRVTLESNAQLELFPENKPAIFKFACRRCGPWTEPGRWGCSSSCCRTPGATCWPDRWVCASTTA